MNFYNENNPAAAAWLRELIKGGHIAPGIVDERSITEISPNELKKYVQVHFFAGIGGWSYALRLAGWPDDKPVWTGSCPCQPFSTAGLQLGENDPRHLWPQFRRLITESGPTIVFGEQVASALGRVWLAGVRADLEELGYAVGGADLCAAGVGAPHRRQRLYWMAHAECGELRAGSGGHRGKASPQLEKGAHADGRSGERDWGDAEKAGATNGTCGLANAANGGCAEHGRESRGRCAARSGDAAERGGLGGLADTNGSESRDGGLQCSGGQLQFPQNKVVSGMEHTKRDGRLKGSKNFQSRKLEPLLPGRSAWSSFELVPCIDGKARRVEPGTFPLAHGVPNRVELLRGYGNAIVPQVAAEFILASAEAISASNA